MYQDPEVAQIIRRLDERKREAVKKERYDHAKKLKQAIADLQKVQLLRTCPHPPGWVSCSTPEGLLKAEEQRWSQRPRQVACGSVSQRLLLLWGLGFCRVGLLSARY